MHKYGNVRPNHFTNGYHMFSDNPLVSVHSCVQSEEKQKDCECTESIEEIPEVIQEIDMPELHEIYVSEEIIEPMVQIEPPPKMYHVVNQVLAKIKLKKQTLNGWQS
jgi:hypothetical protein